MKRQCLLVLLLLLWAGNATHLYGQASAPPQQSPDWVQDKSPLRPAEVSGVVSMLEKLAEYSTSELRDMQLANSAGSVPAALAANQRFLADMRASGFPDAAAWARSHFRVLRVWTILENPDLGKELAESRRQLAQLPPEQRQAMEQALAQAEALYQAPTPEERALVQPKAAYIRELLGRLEMLNDEGVLGEEGDD